MSNLREVLGSIRRGGRARLECPRCGDIVRRSRTPLEGWILPVRYVCDKCGYSGFLAVEEGHESEDASIDS